MTLIFFLFFDKGFHIYFAVVWNQRVGYFYSLFTNKKMREESLLISKE